MDYKECCYVKRARSTQMAFQNRRAGLEIFHKKNIVRFGRFFQSKYRTAVRFSVGVGLQRQASFCYR